jgi:tetratricopeptide (TPR) repeat protein
MIVVFVIALALRAGHIWLLRDSPYFSVLMGDARAYDEWAARIAAGDWLGSEVFYQAPLYPYFLGVLYALFGRDLLIVRLVQAASGAAAAALLVPAGSRLFDRRVGLVAGLLMAFYAPAIFLSALIQKAVLDVVLIVLVILALAHLASNRQDRRWWFALGAALGLLSLTRENALVLIAIGLLFVNRRTLPVFAAAVALVLTPVAARNLIVGGGFYVTTSQLGPNLYIGNNPRATGTYEALREGRGDPAFERNDATELAEAAAGRPLSPGEVSAYWRQQAVEYVTAHPVDWLRLMAAKLLLLVNATEMPDTEAQESHADVSPVLRLLQPVTHFGVMLPLALLGVIVTWQDRRRLGMFYALAGAYAVSVLAFFVVARYRYPLVPFVLLLAAAGLVRLPEFVRHATRRQAAFTAAAVAAIALIAHRPVFASDIMRAITVTNLGVALQADDRLDDAALQYRRAIEIRPDYAPAHNNLGVVLQKRGRLDEAVSAFEQALRYHPDDAGTHMNIGEALLRQGRHDDALRHYRRRVELEPGSLASRYDLGNVLLETRHVEEAEQQFRRLTELAPDAAQAHNRLGVALAAQNRFQEAIASFRTALSLRPDFAEARRFLEMAEQASRQ